MEIKFKNGSSIQTIPTNNVARPSNISLVEFVTDILDFKLLPHQTKILYEIEKYPDEDRLKWFRRGDVHSRYINGWIYKSMWEQYCETGKIEFPFHIDTDNESFTREYECNWERYV